MDLREGLVLKPLEPNAHEDSTHWPEFSLKDVKVLSEATEGCVSLLAAHQDFPIRVEGILEEVDPAHLELVKTTKYRTTRIKLENVVTYSFSQFEDGTFGFWAAGEAGWFEIRNPNKAYRKLFEGMKEATGMFYYLADKYRNTRKNFSNASVKACEKYVKLWFHDYFGSDDDTRASSDTACERFYQHRAFLIKSMLEGQEGLDWEVSPIFRHFERKFTDDFVAIKRVIGQLYATDIDQERVTSARSEDSTKHGTSSSTKAGTVRQKSSVVDTKIILSIDTSESEDDVIEVKSDLSRSHGHKQTSVLRPKGNKSCQKAAARRQSLRKLKQSRSYESDTPEDSGSPMDIDNHPTTNQPGSNSIFLLTDAAQKTSKMEVIFASNVKRTKVRHADSLLPAYFEPRGYGDEWKCSYDNCNHKVWEARHPDSVEMIKQHFLITHRGNAHDLINQESRPWLSVNHLLERVNGMASLQAAVAPQKLGFPARINRRY